MFRANINLNAPQQALDHVKMADEQHTQRYRMDYVHGGVLCCGYNMSS